MYPPPPNKKQQKTKTIQEERKTKQNMHKHMQTVYSNEKIHRSSLIYFNIELSFSRRLVQSKIGHGHRDLLNG